MKVGDKVIVRVSDGSHSHDCPFNIVKKITKTRVTIYDSHLDKEFTYRYPGRHRQDGAYYEVLP